MNGLLRGLRITRRRLMELMLGAAGWTLAGAKPLRAGDAGRGAAGELQRSVAGKVTARDAKGYETLRGSLVWNARKPKRRPDLIVEAASVADVREAVRFARRRGLKVSVRGGGHHSSGTALREGGLLIDVGALRAVEIDAADKTALAQPGVRGGELAAKLAGQGLAFPCGHCSTVPLGGYLLGGGFGWNAGEWGVACWNVRGVDVVTARGELLHADENDHADLFWAARGAGPGFFGVVVGYRLQLFDLPTAIETTTLLYPLGKAGDLARWAAHTGPELPRNVELVLLCLGAPAHLVKHHPRVCTVSATVFARSHQEAVTALQPVAACPVEGSLAKEVNLPASFDSLFGMMDAVFPDGKRCAMDTLWLAGDAGKLLARAAEEYQHAPSPRSLLLCVVPPPPPPDAPPLPDCAFSMVGPVNLGCYAIWDDASADAENVAWLRRTTDAFSDATLGYYVGETDFDAGASRSRGSFSPASWRRLAELRKKYDPAGVFHGHLGRSRE